MENRQKYNIQCTRCFCKIWSVSNEVSDNCFNKLSSWPGIPIKIKIFNPDGWTNPTYIWQEEKSSEKNGGGSIIKHSKSRQHKLRRKVKQIKTLHQLTVNQNKQGESVEKLGTEAGSHCREQVHTSFRDSHHTDDPGSPSSPSLLWVLITVCNCNGLMAFLQCLW